jgi:hypothetical protein
MHRDISHAYFTNQDFTEYDGIVVMQGNDLTLMRRDVSNRRGNSQSNK